MVKQGLLKAITKFIKFKKELIYLTIGLALLLALLLALYIVLFNKPILENVENIKKLELTLMKPPTDSSANMAFISLYNDIKTNYSSNTNIIFEEKMCSGTTLDDFLKTCTEGNLTYDKFLQAKVPTWKTNCPALVLTLVNSSMANTGSGRTYINELGFETNKNSITLTIAKEVIDKAIRDYIPPAPLPPPPPAPPPSLPPQPPPVETPVPVPGPAPTNPIPPNPVPSNPPTPVPPSQGPTQGPPVPASQNSQGYTTTTTTTTTAGR